MAPPPPPPGMQPGYGEAPVDISGYGGPPSGFYGGPPGPPPSQVAQEAEALDNASDMMTHSRDGGAAFLRRYRGAGTGAMQMDPRRQGGVRQTALGGAPLTDKYGNLI